MNFENLNIEKLKKDAENFSLFANDSYIESYPEFLKYFESIEFIEKHHLIISSHFVYGWMPTIIHLDINNLSEVLVLLNNAKAGHQLNMNEIEVLKYCINNSMVGLSKLLHFVNPDDYAIWDSRIMAYISEKEAKYNIGKAEHYLAYLEKMKEIINQIEYPSLHCSIEKHFNYPLTPLRAVEVLMFATERNKTINKKLV